MVEVLSRHRAHLVYEESLLNPFKAAWMVGRAARYLFLQGQ